jgi:fructose-1,6-bisphosphatase/inositol monophosphatase family enzyme
VNPVWVQFAHQLADAAGDAIRPFFGAHGTVESKADQSPVTEADRAAEAAMRALIAAHYPEHTIYGEEFGATNVAIPPPNGGRLGGGRMDTVAPATPPLALEPVLPPPQPSPVGGGSAGNHSSLTTSYTWVLDPIDGTRAFIAGGHEWGTLIALCENGVPVLGVLNQPITGERWVGVVEEATVYYSPLEGKSKSASDSVGANVGPASPHGSQVLARSPSRGEQIKTRACASLAEASISTTSRNYFTPPQAHAFVKLAAQCAEVTENGDCYAYGMLARGLRDVVVDAGLKPYDILALVPIIEGAGGKITAWDGAAVTLSNYDTALAVGDAALYAEVLETLRC